MSPTPTVKGPAPILQPKLPGSSSGSAIGYSSVGKGTYPDDVTFPITPEQIAMVQYIGSDFTNAPEPAVTGDSPGGCFWNDLNEASPDDPDPDHRRYSGGGFVTGDGTVTLSLSAMTGGNGGVINVIVVALGSSACVTGH